MASWVIDYTNDFGTLQKYVKLTVKRYQLSETTLPTSQITDVSFDRNFLPKIFLDNAVYIRDSVVYCNLELGSKTERHVQAYVGKEEYIHVPLPFIGGSTSFETFYKQLGEKTNVEYLILKGEHISESFVRLFTFGNVRK